MIFACRLVVISQPVLKTLIASFSIIFQNNGMKERVGEQRERKIRRAKYSGRKITASFVGR
jgi:hypothetical protein